MRAIPLAALLALLLTLAACGDDDDSDSPATAPPPSSAAETASAGGELSGHDRGGHLGDERLHDPGRRHRGAGRGRRGRAREALPADRRRPAAPAQPRSRGSSGRWRSRRRCRWSGRRRRAPAGCAGPTPTGMELQLADAVRVARIWGHAELGRGRRRPPCASASRSSRPGPTRRACGPSAARRPPTGPSSATPAPSRWRSPASPTRPPPTCCARTYGGWVADNGVIVESLPDAHDAFLAWLAEEPVR